MQSLKPQMCQIDEVPTNSQTERDIATEVPIRMNVILPQCWVVLHRLTEEEIYQSYPDSYSSSEISADVIRKTEELLNRTVQAVPHKDHDYSQDYESGVLGKNRLRELSRSRNAVYERYRESRREFLKRRNRNFDHSSDSSDFPDMSDMSDVSDMSGDEMKRSNSQGQGKKKGKRGRKYERDSEWSPYSPSKFQYGRRLRRNIRRPIIESDSSSTDQEDILYAIYMSDNGNSSSTSTAFQNSVPSVDDILSASSTSSISKATVESDVSDKAISAKTCNISSQTNVNCDTSSVTNNSQNSDIISGIMREMDKCKNVTNKIKPPLSREVQKTPPLNNIKPKGKRGKKRLLPSSDDSESNINSTVAGILKEMVNTVCIQHGQLDIKNKKKFRKCKWCHTQFAINSENETMCAICRDQGKDKLTSNNPNKNNKPSKDKILKKSPKQTIAGKLGRKVSTMSRVLKNLPKTEMQRLMYADKSTKLSNEKGYNHCKSFNTPKDSLESLNDTVVKSPEGKISPPSKLPEKVSAVAKTNFIKDKKKSAKKSSNWPKNQTATLAKPNSMKSTSSSGVNVECEKSPQKKNQVSLKKYNEGLFLMSFPDPDKELNIGVQENKSHKSQTIEKTKVSESLCRFNGSRATETSEKPNSSLATKKSPQSVINEEQYQTYLLPPVPTVLVANYSSNNDKSGNYRLSSIFYQNKLTQQSHVQNSINLKGKSPSLTSTTSGLPTVVIPNQNVSPPRGLLNNSSLSITTIPLDNGVSNVQPFINNSMPVINSFASTSLSNSVTLMPIVSSVVSLSDKSIDQSSSLNNTCGTFTNSDQLQIRINNVYSENTNENKLDASRSEFNMNNNGSSLLENRTKISKSLKISRKRSNSSESIFSNKTKMFKENSESDTDISENDGETPELTENTAVSAETDKNVQSENNIVSNKSDLLKNSEISLKAIAQGSDINEQTEVNNQSVHESNKPVESGDNSSPKDAIKSAIDLLEAVSILAVIDLEKNPRQDLFIRTQMAKTTLGKLTSEKNPGPEHNEKIASCQHNLEVLEIALKFLNIYGSFAKVSDHLMRKQKMEKLIQIKKEMLDEEDKEEEEVNQSSCRFSQKSQSNNSFNNQDLPKTPDIPSPATVKMESFNSCRLNEQSAAINHIEKLQSQIAAMNNAQLMNNTQLMNNSQLMNSAQYDATTSTVHHFAGEQYGALTPAVAAPAPITPRNDCMGGESRETPSRGSGPRTPARPESATSQPEEQSLAAQVKKEQFEASTSPSQCAYSQNISLTQISSQMPVMQDMSSLNMGGNTVQQIAVSGTVNQIFTNGQTSVLNRTTSYNNSQNYSNVLVNIASRQQVPTPGINTNVDQNGQLLIRQQLYLPNGTQISQKQTVPSLNNQYLIPSYSSTNTAGSVIVNNSQAGGQNVNALLTNVSNQQFYTSNQVSQLYYPPPSSSQLACMKAPNVTVVQNQDVIRNSILKKIFGMPGHLYQDIDRLRSIKHDIDILKSLQPATENMDQMYCAVCKSVATLRCKQCAKVAYCNTTCAKTYWHQKHKMECKPLPS